MRRMADLTAIILTKNEELNLRKCVNSIKSIVKEIIIVDSYSSDNTLEIAKELGVTVLQHEFENHAIQFNWALENAYISTAWVMKVDADEEFTPELVDEISERLDYLPESVNGVILRRRVYFMGRWLRHGGKYPELLLRIFRFGYGMSELKNMDEHIIISNGRAVTFKNDFIDRNNKSLEWWISKHNWYSNKEVYDYQKRTSDEGVEGTSQSIQAKLKRFVKRYGYYSLPKFLRAHMYFIYRYYFRLGFLDGVEGRIYTFLQAYWYRFLVDAKIFECDKYNFEMKEQRDLKVESSIEDY